MPRLTDEERTSIISEINAGKNIIDLSHQFNVRKQTIYNLRAKYAATGSVSNIPRSGRPRLSSAREDRHLVRICTQNPHSTSRGLTSVWPGVHASASTVRRRLRQGGLHGLIAPRKPALNPRHKKERLKFAREHQHWTSEMWASVIWTDETPIHLVTSIQQRYIWTRGGSTNCMALARPTQHSGGGRVMVWGAFYGQKTVPLRRIIGNLNGAKYLEILQDVMPNCPPHHLWMDDNAPPHRSHIVKEWVVNQNREVVDWPANSPDINPIENAWAELKRRVEVKGATSLEVLWKFAEEEWKKLDESFFKKLTDSMPRRMTALIEAKGGSIKY